MFGFAPERWNLHLNVNTRPTHNPNDRNSPPVCTDPVYTSLCPAHTLYPAVRRNPRPPQHSAVSHCTTSTTCHNSQSPWKPCPLSPWQYVERCVTTRQSNLEQLIHGSLKKPCLPVRNANVSDDTSIAVDPHWSRIFWLCTRSPLSYAGNARPSSRLSPSATRT